MRAAQFIVQVSSWVFLMIVSNTLQAAEAEVGFYSSGRLHSLTLDKDHVVVAQSGNLRTVPTAGYSSVEHERFAMMELAVVPRTSPLANQTIVGYPVRFSRQHEAVGVLTREIVVRISSPLGMAAIRAEQDFAAMSQLPLSPDVYVARFSSPMAALKAANRLYKNQAIAYAHPNFMIPKDWRQANAAPRRQGQGPSAEPLYGKQWHLENAGLAGAKAGADIHVNGAWKVTNGKPQVVVAVLDGGFEVSHPDLKAAWWSNEGEIMGNGIDDDANGYIDDTSGWNFWSKNADVGGGPVADHGTSVVGLVAADVNGIGVSGVCPSCRVMPVVLAWTPAEDAAAFWYAAKNGAAIISNSWGYPIGTPSTDVVEDAIEQVVAEGRGGKGTIVLFAMNNIDQDDCIGATPDISSLAAVIAVSASSDQDKKVTQSAWGECMEILGPSFEKGRSGIVTTDVTGARGYNTGRRPGELGDLDYTNYFGGTSAATPISAGVFALMLSVNPELTRKQSLALVVQTADKISPNLAGYDARTGFSKKYGFGRINAERAVGAALAQKKASARRESLGAGAGRRR